MDRDQERGRLDHAADPGLALEPVEPGAPRLTAPLLPGLTAAERGPVLEAARRSGLRTVLLRLADQLLVVIPGGPGGVTWMDAAAPDFPERLDRDGGLEDPEASRQWLRFARQAVGQGIERRERGEFPEAYVHQRFAMCVAQRLGDVEGVSAIALNIWTLRESIRDVTERGRGPARTAQPSRGEPSLADALRRTLEFMRADAGGFVRAAAELADAGEAGPARDRALLQARHRLAGVAGDRPARSVALRALIEDDAGSRAEADRAVLAALEELADMDLHDALTAAGVTDGRADGGAADAWPRYRRLRTRLGAVRDVACVVPSADNAFHHLCHLRLRATTAGGAFGHELSYAVSALLQIVGRDLAGLMRRLGRDDAALSVAETLLARSMADWMARTHAIWAPPPETTAVIGGLTGSLNAVAVAGLDEIREAARAAGAAIIYYLWQEDHYVAWLVRTDGRIVADRVEDPAPRLARVLPSMVSESRAPLPPRPGADGEEGTFAGELAALFAALFPRGIREGLADQGERLVIIADPSLQSVPFSALRTPAGSYLVEEREIVFWPSVTAHLNLEAGGRVPPWRRARVPGGRPPLVMGIGTFDRAYRMSDGEGDIEFDDLPDALREAEQVATLLRTRACRDRAATMEALLTAGRGTTVIHVATHGYLDEAHPRRSFLALADGPLSADALYRHDRGVQTGLVVLSACETALGGEHADSVIGLANAFLIAGAGSVLSTLWPISDDVTPAFMSRFYGSILEAGGLAKALRAAQRALLGDPATSDPFYWAPFMLSGRVASPFAAGPG